MSSVLDISFPTMCWWWVAHHSGIPADAVGYVFSCRNAYPIKLRLNNCVGICEACVIEQQNRQESNFLDGTEIIRLYSSIEHLQDLKDYGYSS